MLIVDGQYVSRAAMLVEIGGHVTRDLRHQSISTWRDSPQEEPRCFIGFGEREETTDNKGAEGW